MTERGATSRGCDIVAIDHVQLAMPAGGEDRARWFYEAVLGLSEVEKPEPLASRGGCWFERPGVIVHLGVQEEFVPSRKAHPAFLVERLESLRERCEDHGIAIAPDGTLPDVSRFFVHDPFGNRIEFLQHGHGFSQRS